MQNKPILIGIAAAIIILLGAGGVFLYSQNKATPTPNNTSATVTPTPENSSLEGSIKDIFQTAGNKKCDFNVKDSKGETKGIFYVSGTKAAGEIQLISSGKTVTTNVIRSGDTFYMWGDSLPTGIKMTVSVDDLAGTLGSGQNSSLNPDQKISFNCTGWTLDSTKFNPPTNIKFTEISTPASPKTTGTSYCSVCNSLSGSAKTACLAQYNCQ